MELGMRLLKNIYSGTPKHVAGGPYTYFKFSNSQKNKKQKHIKTNLVGTVAHEMEKSTIKLKIPSNYLLF